MSESIKAKNLWQRINEVRKAVDFIQKDKKVEGYMAVTHDQVTGILREHLIAQGIGTVVRLVSGSTVESGTKTKSGTPIVRFEGVYDVTFVNIDEPSDRETFTIPSHAMDHGDKAPGKATSYAVKGAFLKGLNIETGENEESRYGSDDELPIEKLIEIEDALRACANQGELKRFLDKALSLASEAGDRHAEKRFNALAEKLREKLPNVTQPQSKSSKGEAQPPAGDDGPVGGGGEEEETGEVASAGLVKMIKGVAEARNVDAAELKKMCGGKAVEKLTKVRGAEVLKKLQELKA